MASQRICLSMIVRDEAHVISRCLRSVRGLITDWSIVDTGSVDDTADVVRAELDGLPGEVLHRPWRDFGHNRTEALEAARQTGADYALVMDADDHLEQLGSAAEFPVLRAPTYTLQIRDHGMQYLRRQVFRLDLPWRYAGVAHEYPICTLDDGTTVDDSGHITEFAYVRVNAGARHADRTASLTRDVDLLSHGVMEEPGNARYVFYLAQTLHELGRNADALGWYVWRIAMGGWDEEVFCATFRAGRILAWGIGTTDAGLRMLHDAANSRPWRAEPLSVAAQVLNACGRHAEAAGCAERAMNMDIPAGDILFVETSLYGAFPRLQYVIACRGLGRMAEARRVALDIVHDPEADSSTRQAAEEHLAQIRE